MLKMGFEGYGLKGFSPKNLIKNSKYHSPDKKCVPGIPIRSVSKPFTELGKVRLQHCVMTKSHTSDQRERSY